MGRLANIYDKDKDDGLRRIELIFPVVGKSVFIHRPDYDEEQYITTRLDSLRGDKDIEPLAGAVILKNLCDEPNLREEDEAELEKDIRAMESPDRKAILNMWEALTGKIPKSLGQLFMSDPDLFR